MKIEPIKQRSTEWHAWRKTGLSASTAMVVLGQSPYKTRWRLWAEKTGKAVEPDLSKNPHVQRGIKFEDVARQVAEHALGDVVLLPVCVRSSRYPFMIASLDGIDDHRAPVELKCPSDRSFADIVARGEDSKPYHFYRHQVVHQAICTGSDHGWLVFYHVTTRQYRKFRIAATPRESRNLLLQSEVFWDRVQTGVAPELDPTRDLYVPKGNQLKSWISLSKEYRGYEQRIDELQSEIEKLKERSDEVLACLNAQMGEFMHANVAGVSVTRFHRKGKVDYPRLLKDKIPELLPAEIDLYRSQSSVVCRATLNDGPIPNVAVENPLKKSLEDLDEAQRKVSYFW